MKPMAKYIFRNVDGLWRECSSESEILANVLHKLDIDFRDKCEFARYKDYNNNMETIFLIICGKHRVCYAVKQRITAMEHIAKLNSILGMDYYHYEELKLYE